jgi:UDP-glucose 4-epimerase
MDIDVSPDFSSAIVTGGGGFIGSHLAEYLVDHGVETYSVDDYSTGKRDNVAHLRDRDGFHDVTADVTDRVELEPVFEEHVDVVFHNAAAKKTICLEDPRRDLAVNAEGTFNVLDLSTEYGVEKVVHASTGSVYGEPEQFPQDEAHPLNPNSYYGVSKLAGELYAMVFEDLHDLDVTVLRYFHVYGPRQEDDDDVGGVVAIWAKRLNCSDPLIVYGDGTQERSFTSVEDVVRANIFVAGHPKTRGEAYNCGSGIQVDLNELVEIMQDVSDTEVSVEYEAWRPGDIKDFEVDNSKLTSLGFEFDTELTDGIRDTIEWIRRQHDGAD